jgi:hypothetical protein
MLKSIRNIIKEVISENTPNESIVVDRVRELLDTLRSTVSDVKNDWTAKAREEFIFNKIIGLSFVEDGKFISNNKECKKKLGAAYNSRTPSEFTTLTIKQYFKNIDEDSIFFIKEPFGSRKSPDFLFISSKGVYGIEDKSSRSGKITFNTGTPGGNKIIMYYNTKTNKIYLTSGENWGWDENIEDEYRKFTERIKKYAQSEFEKQFGERIQNMSYYARPMLVDKNLIDTIWDKDEKEVMSTLRKYI